MWLSYVIVTAVVAVVAFAGSALTDTGPWYRQLRKPAWNPPDWAFGAVWSTVFLFIIIAVGQAWNHGSADDRQALLWVTGINFVLNVLWSALFFALRRPGWALVQVVFFWLSIVAMMVVFARFHPLSAWLLAPYLIWVTIATALNASIVRLNPDASRMVEQR